MAVVKSAQLNVQKARGDTFKRVRGDLRNQTDTRVLSKRKRSSGSRKALSEKQVVEVPPRVWIPEKAPKREKEYVEGEGGDGPAGEWLSKRTLWRSSHRQRDLDKGKYLEEGKEWNLCATSMGGEGPISRRVQTSP